MIQHSKEYGIPVLFVFFNRREVALQSFERIRKARPAKLYLACDGPRHGVAGDAEKVEQTRRAVLERIDWPCEVHQKFETANLGCADGVYSAICWLFQHEECGIILEDDCVPQDSFFPFVEEMMVRYWNDERVGMVDGANYIKQVALPHSYCFSNFKSTNGWATWRRAWKRMDMDMKWRHTPMEDSVLLNTGFQGRDYKYWKYKLKVIDHKQASAWDWQWYFTLAAQHQLAVCPCKNLITNIGFGPGATHTTNMVDTDQYKANGDLTFPLDHPLYVAPYLPFEKAFYKANNTLFYTVMRYIPFSIKNMVKKIVR